MIQNDQIHAACSSPVETTTPDEGYEHGLDNQLALLRETLERLVYELPDDRLAEAAAELEAALSALDVACAFSDDELTNGTSDEDADVQELVAEELAGITRRLKMLLALAAVRDAARTVGWIACRREAVQDEPDAVEHCAPANDVET